MALRKLRWLAAGVLAAVAVVASPARSAAATTILLQEFDGSNNPFGSSLSFLLGVSTLPSSATPAVTANFSVSSIGVTPFNNANGSGSISTTIITSPKNSSTAAYDPTHYLQVVVTSDGFLNPPPGTGGSGILKNDPSQTSTTPGDMNTITGKTTLLTGPIGSTSPFIPPTSLTDTEATGAGDASSTANVSNVPAQYTIQQTLTIRLAGAVDDSFTDQLSSSLTVSPPAAVPAPAGLVLALTALPVLGLRRVLRRKATA